MNRVAPDATTTAIVALFSLDNAAEIATADS